MRVAIVHYHLRPGGVTRVIEQTSKALTETGIANVVLADGIPGLGYGGNGDPQGLIAILRASAISALGGPPDVWIFHNPTLGKNRDLPEVIACLAADGEAVLLHIHDLAEEGRQGNFAQITDPSRLHLTATRVHHAFINARDRARFLEAGLPPDRAHLLPNPVVNDSRAGLAAKEHCSNALHSPQSHIEGAPLVFYPVRGIRRKNLGEICLLAALAPEGARFAISRAPENPEEIPTHDFWRNFATAHALPVWFDVVDRLAPFRGVAADFQTWSDTATHWITTSVAEGFGQTGAEAAARRKPLIARALEASFDPTERRGIYEHIRIAGMPADFSSLDESAQAEVIRRAISNPGFAKSIRIDSQPARIWLRQRLEDRSRPPADPQLDRHTPLNMATTLIGVLESIIRQPPGSPEFLPQRKIANLYRDAPPLLTHPRPRARSEFPRAVIFDVYGTLLDAPPGGVRPTPSIDPAIINFLENNDCCVPGEPTARLASLVAREHAKSQEMFPEIDLVALWAELLGLPADTRMEHWVAEIEDLWHPAAPMPGALAMLRRLASVNIPCGLLSNAQANVWRQLGGLAPCFASDLCVFSHQFLRAKPSPALFAEMTSRLACRGIAPHEVWFIGNDPVNDIDPGNAAGFRTLVFSPAKDDPNTTCIRHWDEFRPG